MNIKKLAWYAFGPIGSVFLGLGTIPILAWFYDVETVGQISLLIVTTNFFLILCCFGMDQNYIRSYHEELNKKKLLFNMILPGTLFFLVLLLINFLKQDFLGFLFPKINSIASTLIIFNLYSVFLLRFLTLDFRMTENAKVFSLYQVLPKIIYLISIIGAVFFLDNRDINELIIIYCLSNIVPALYLFLKFSRNLRDFKLLEKRSFLQTFKYSFPFVISGLIYSFFSIIDRYLITIFSNLSELGKYSIAVSIAGAATIFVSIFNTIWAPTIFKKLANSDESINIEKNAIACISIILILILIVGILSPFIPLFLPKDYINIEKVVIVYLLVPLFYMLSEITGVGILVVKKTNVLILCYLACLVFNLITSYFLIPYYGAIGAAVSVALSYYIFFLLKTYFGFKYWKKYHLLRLLWLSVIMLIMPIFYVIISNNFDSIFIHFSYWLLFFCVIVYINVEVYKSLFKFLINKLIGTSK